MQESLPNGASRPGLSRISWRAIATAQLATHPVRFTERLA